MFGIILALLAGIFWGSYIVPLVKLKDSPLLIVSIATTMSFIVSLIVYSILLPGLTLKIIFFGFIAGILWSFAQVSYLTGLRGSKFGRYQSICASAQILLNFALGIVIFSEILGAGYTNLLIAVIGILLLVVGVFYVSSIKEKGKPESRKMSLFFSVFAAVLWSLQFVSFRLANASPFAIVFPMTFGMMVTAWIYTILKNRNISMPSSTLKMSSLSGLLWIIGNYFAFSAINDIGLARGFSIAQISVLIGVLWSILYLREFMGKKKIFFLILSSVLIILGAALLAFAKS